MSATTQVTTFSDLYTDLQNRVREQTGVTATENQAKRYINIALHDMHIGWKENLPWAERGAVLITQDDYTTGTVTISQGSTSLSGASTAWNTANAFGNTNMQVGGKITIAGTLDVYEISAVSSDTAATLTGAYVGSDASADTYTYFEDEYALASDFLRPLDQQSFSDSIPIDLISRMEFRRRYPNNRNPGRPKVATIVDKTFSSSTTPVRKIRLHPPPDDFYNIPYSYITSNLAVSASGTEQVNLSADTDEPIVPVSYRHAIIFHALYHWYRDKKNDERSQEAKAEYLDIMNRIVGDVEIGNRHPSIRPRQGPYVRHASRPWSRGSGRFDDQGRFDRFEI